MRGTFLFILPLAGLLIGGCATGVKETPLKYDQQSGTYTKSYSTGELGSGFVKSLLGVGGKD